MKEKIQLINKVWIFGIQLNFNYVAIYFNETYKYKKIDFGYAELSYCNWF